MAERRGRAGDLDRGYRQELSPVLDPKIDEIVPRLFWPFLALALASAMASQALLVWSPEAFTLHYFRQPLVLVAVHLSTLGFLGLVFLAVSTQALSVLLHQPRAAFGRSLAALAAFGCGVLGLLAYFGAWRQITALGLALVGLWAGFSYLALHAGRLARGSEVGTTAWQGLRNAFAYLGLLLLLGSLMGVGLLQPLLPQDPLDTLRLHVHLGLWGFAAMAIFGLLPKLLRLFQGAKGYASWPQRAAFAGIHAGLALELAAWLRPGLGLEALAAAVFMAAGLAFVGQLALLLRAGRKSLLNSSLLTQGLAVVCLLLAAALDLRLSLQPGTWQAQAAAFYLGLVGFVGGSIVGTLQRIGAILSWFQRFYEPEPTQVVPMAWELIDPRLAYAVPLLHFGGVACGAVGLWHGQAFWIRSGGILGLGALLATLGLLALSRVRGKAEPFPGGVNPYL